MNFYLYDKVTHELKSIVSHERHDVEDCYCSALAAIKRWDGDVYRWFHPRVAALQDAEAHLETEVQTLEGQAQAGVQHAEGEAQAIKSEVQQAGEHAETVATNIADTVEPVADAVDTATDKLTGQPVDDVAPSADPVQEGAGEISASVQELVHNGG